MGEDTTVTSTYCYQIVVDCRPETPHQQLCPMYELEYFLVYFLFLYFNIFTYNIATKITPQLLFVMS